MNILVVDDEKEIADVIELYLQNDQYNVYKFYTGQDALDCIKNMKIDLAILDIMLPDVDGFQILKQIREKYTFPVIMLTAKVEDGDKIMGLSVADDYITKPFGVMELISRVKALLRRTQSAAEETKICHGEIRMDNDKHAVFVGNEPCELTFKEYELLKYLMINAGIVLSRDKIMDQVWGFEYEGESRTVDMHIKTLRQKLGAAGSCLKTIRNVGYMIE